MPIRGCSKATKNIPEFLIQVNELISVYGSMLVNNLFPYQNLIIFESHVTIMSYYISIFLIGNRY